MDTEEALNNEASAKKLKVEAALAVPKLEKNDKKSMKTFKEPTPKKKAESTSLKDNSSEYDVEASSKVTFRAKRIFEVDKKDIHEKPKDKVGSSDESGDNYDVGADKQQNKKLKTQVESSMQEIDGGSVNEPAKDDKHEVSVPARSTIFLGNLSFGITKDEIVEFFKDVGEVVEVRLVKFSDDHCKGFGYVDFATTEEVQKALELNGQDLSGRAVKIDLEEMAERRANNQSGISYQNGGAGFKQTVLITGFDISANEEQIRSSLQEHFGSCGVISRISVPCSKTGVSRGMAFMDFSSNEDALNNALALNGSKLEGHALVVVKSCNKPKSDDDNSGGRGVIRGRGRGGKKFGGRRGRRVRSARSEPDLRSGWKPHLQAIRPALKNFFELFYPS